MDHGLRCLNCGRHVWIAEQTKQLRVERIAHLCLKVVLLEAQLVGEAKSQPRPLCWSVEALDERHGIADALDDVFDRDVLARLDRDEVHAKDKHHAGIRVQEAIILGAGVLLDNALRRDDQSDGWLDQESGVSLAHLLLKRYDLLLLLETKDWGEPHLADHLSELMALKREARRYGEIRDHF